MTGLNKAFLAVALSRHLDAITEHNCKGCCAKAVLAAATNWNQFETVDPSAQNDLETVQIDILEYAQRRVLDLARKHGMSSHQATGVMLHMGHALQVDVVDKIVANNHPLSRLAFLSTVQRLLVQGTINATVLRAIEDGYIADVEDVAPQIEALLTVLDSMPPTEVLDHMVNKHAGDGADVLSKDAELLETLEAMVKELPEPLQQALTHKINDLRSRITAGQGGDAPDGTEPAIKVTTLDDKTGMVETNMDTPDDDVANAIFDAIAKAPDAPKGLTREALRDGLRQAKEQMLANGGEGVVVLRLGK